MRKVFYILVIGSVLGISCKKNDTGGEASIEAIAKHHDLPIPAARIYIKYGAKDFPGEDVSQYDASFQADNTGKVTIENLRYGDYYLYGVGFDSSIMLGVTGGTSTKIKWGERKESTTLTVPVTE